MADRTFRYRYNPAFPGGVEARIFEDGAHESLGDEWKNSPAKVEVTDGPFDDPDEVAEEVAEEIAEECAEEIKDEAEESPEVPAEEVPVKRGPGRPPGSTNKKD